MQYRLKDAEQRVSLSLHTITPPSFTEVVWEFKIKDFEDAATATARLHPKIKHPIYQCLLIRRGHQKYRNTGKNLSELTDRCINLIVHKAHRGQRSCNINASEGFDNRKRSAAAVKYLLIIFDGI